MQPSKVETVLESVGILSEDKTGQTHTFRGPLDLHAANLIIYRAHFSEDGVRGEDL